MRILNPTHLIHVSILAICAIVLTASQAHAYTLLTDITYNSPGGLSNTLDIYRPDTPNTSLPTLLYIHGGGWRSGDKSSNAQLHRELADAGYTVISCNYTLSTQVSPSFPQAVHDVKAVIRWIRTVGVQKYNMSPEIVPFGTSAGGHLAMMLQTTAGMPFFEPLSPPPGGYQVQAAISFWGPSNLVDMAIIDDFANDPRLVAFLGGPYNAANADTWAMASPITHLDINDPPLTLYHGIVDDIVPFSQSPPMHDAAVASGILSWFFPFDGGHGFGSDLGGRSGGVLRMRQVIPAMVAGNSLTNTPITSIKFNSGSIVSGDPSSLFSSDDTHLQALSGASLLRRTQYSQLSMSVKFETGISNPQTINLGIESRINAPSGILAVYLKNSTTSQLELIGKLPISSTDTTNIIPSIDITSSISDLKDIDLTLTFTATPPPSSTKLKAWIDHIEIRAD